MNFVTLLMNAVGACRESCSSVTPTQNQPWPVVCSASEAAVGISSCWEVGLFCQSSHFCDQSQPGLRALRGPVFKPVTPSRRQVDLGKGSSISNLESTSIKFLLIWNSVLGRNIITSSMLIGRKLLALGSSDRGLPLPSPVPGLHSPMLHHTRHLTALKGEMNSVNSKKTTFRSIARSQMTDTIFKDFFVHKMAFELGTCLARFSCYNLLIHWVENGRAGWQSQTASINDLFNRSCSNRNAY